MKSLLSIFALLAIFSISIRAETASPEIRYIASEAAGDGSAVSPGHAAHYLAPEFWQTVQNQLAKTPVTVRFLDGNYRAETLILQKIGHPENRLVLEPANPGGAIFDGDLPFQIRLRGVQNATLRDLHFTGPTQNFALHIRSETGHPARNLAIENCRFIDLDKATYGALGISGEVVDLLVKNNTFQRVGYSAHAHMVYTTHGGFGPGPLRFESNLFEDSSGDYLRLRNQIGYTEIVGNTFVSNSVAKNRPFIAMPIFNTKSPGAEIISDNVLIAENTFRYHPWEKQDWDRGIAICLSSYGHDPADRRYLLTPDQAEIIRSAPVEEAGRVFREIAKINPETLRLANNRFENAYHEIGFGAFAHFEAESRGWEGFIDIARLAHRTVSD